MAREIKVPVILEQYQGENWRASVYRNETIQAEGETVEEAVERLKPELEYSLSNGSVPDEQKKNLKDKLLHLPTIAVTEIKTEIEE